MRKLIYIVIVAITLVVFTLNIYGSSISELEEQQKEIEAEKEANEAELQEILAQKEGIEAEIIESDIRLGDATSELESINLNLDAVNEELAQAEIDLANAEAQRDEQEVVLQERLRNMYEYGEVTYLDAFVGSEDFVDVINQIEYINEVGEYDQNLYNNYIATVEEIDTKVAEIEEHKAEIETLQADAEAQVQEIENEIEKKRYLVTSLEENASTIEGEIDDLEYHSDEIEEQIQEEIKKQEAAQSTQIANYNYTGGQLGYPAPGYYSISSGYGPRTHPITGEVMKMHNGIDFPVPSGSTIVAAEDGVVTTAGYVNGYGYTIIISHGSGLSTLYAHNSSLTVSVGDTVTKGQQVAKSGSTGNSTGPHCHFEVRVNGSPTNPVPYLQ